MDTKLTMSDLKPISFVLYSIIIACFGSYTVAETMLVKNFAVFFLFVSMACLSVCFFFCQSNPKKSSTHSTEFKKDHFDDEFKQAITSFNTGVKNDLQLIRKDLKQIKHLIRDASSNLTENFYSISSRIDQQQRLMDSVINHFENDSVNQSAESIKMINQLIKEDAGNCIRTLQFEDIVGQVSDHAVLYLDDIEKYLGNLLSLIQAMENGKPVLVSTGEFRKLTNITGTNPQDYHQFKRANITQKDLAAGHIELF